MDDDPLEPDQVRLTTGEVVRFRLLVKTSKWNPSEAESTIQSSRPLLWARLDGPVATRLADLESVLLDIRFANACCHRLIASVGGAIRLDPIIQGALWRSVLISYRRCFTSGARSQATVPPAEDMQRSHRDFMALANGHIAHSVDHFEEFQVFALGRPEDDPPQAVGVHVMGVSHQLGAPDELVRLHKLIQAVEKATVDELAPLRDNVLTAARSANARELFANAGRRAEPMSRIGGPSKTSGRRPGRRDP